MHAGCTRREGGLDRGGSGGKGAHHDHQAPRSRNLTGSGGGFDAENEAAETCSVFAMGCDMCRRDRSQKGPLLFEGGCAWESTH